MQPKTKTVLFILFSFLLGGICGSLIMMNFWVPKKPQPPTHQEFLKMFQERVKLSNEQLAQADSIFNFTKQKIDSYRKVIAQTKDSARMAVKKNLSAEQVAQFDEFFREINKMNGKKSDSISHAVDSVQLKH